MATHAARSAPLSASLRARRAAPRATLLAVSNGAHLPAERKDELRQTAELVGRAGKVRTARHAHGTAVGGGVRQQSARCCAAGAEACALRPERGVGRGCAARRGHKPLVVCGRAFVCARRATRRAGGSPHSLLTPVNATPTRGEVPRNCD